jgi:hypothetical protein
MRQRAGDYSFAMQRLVRGCTLRDQIWVSAE